MTVSYSASNPRAYAITDGFRRSEEVQQMTQLYRDIAAMQRADLPYYTPPTSPISWISVQLLQKIFSHLHDEVGSTPPRAGAAPSCTALTQVCRPWRYVAFLHKPLWTTIALGSLTWTTIALEMSRPLPIDVQWERGARTRAFQLAVAEISRFRRLQVDTRDSEWAAQLQDALLWHPAPQLRELVVERGTRLPLRDLRVAHGGIPALQEIRFSGLVISPLSMFFRSGLTVLDLEACRVWDDFEQIADTLAHIPGLRTLRLRDSLPPRGAAPRNICLPSLNDLTLSDSESRVAAFLWYLRMPCRMAAVRIHTTEPNSPLLLHALELWLAAPLRPKETYRRWEAASDPARPDRFLVVATAPVSPSGATTLPSTFVVEVALPMPPHLPGVWEACWMCAWHLVGTLSFLKNASCVGHPRPPAPAAAPIQLHVRQHLEEPGVSSDTAGGLFDTTWPFSLSTSISQANTDHGIMGPVLNVRGWPMQNREPLAAGYQGIMGPRSQSRPAGYHGIMCPQAKWVDGGFSSRY